MDFGMCGGRDKAELAAAAGFSYMESGVAAELVPLESDEAFRRKSAAWKDSPLPLEALNGFIPGDLKICSPDSPTQALYAYARTAICRAAEIGIRRIVFGSGGARAIPDGYARDAAWKQLVAFSRFCAKEAAAAGVTIVLEPLNSRECNIITGVREGAELVREVNSPAFRLLVDGYHWGMESETVADIASCKGLLAHAHVATWPSRKAPGREECVLADFFRALKLADYDLRLSVEARIESPEAEYAGAFSCLSAVEAAVNPVLV